MIIQLSTDAESAMSYASVDAVVLVTHYETLPHPTYDAYEAPGLTLTLHLIGY